MSISGGNIYNDPNIGNNTPATYVLSDGTVTNPAIKFATDPQTGFYKASSGTVGIASAGSVAATIGSAATVINSSATTISGTLGVSGDTSLSGNLLLADNKTVTTQCDPNAASLFQGYYINNLSNVKRIGLGIFGTETGSNEGANFSITAYDDDGKQVDNVLVVTRTNYQIATKASITSISTNPSSFSANINMQGNTVINEDVKVTTFAGTSGTANNRAGVITFTNSSSLANGAFVNYTVNNSYCASLTPVFGTVVDSNDTNSFSFLLYRVTAGGGVILFGIQNLGPATSTNWTISLYFKLLS